MRRRNKRSNTAAKLPVTTGRRKWNSARQGPREGTYARIAHLNTLPQLLKSIQEKDTFPVPRFITYGAPILERHLSRNVGLRQETGAA
jgi:hypothetical protein